MKRFELKQMAKDQLRGNWGHMALFTLYMCIPVVIYLLGDIARFMPRAFFGGRSEFLPYSNVPMMPRFMTLYFLWVLAYEILMVIMSLGYLNGCFQLAKGERPKFSTLFSRALPAWKSVVIGLFLAVCVFISVAFTAMLVTIISLSGFQMVAVAVGIVLGIAVFSFIIWLQLALAMTPFIIVESPEMRVFDIIKTSINMMDKNKWRLFVIYLSFSGWIILGSLPFYIGTLWVAPYMYMTLVNFYNDIKDKNRLEQLIIESDNAGFVPTDTMYDSLYADNIKAEGIEEATDIDIVKEEIEQQTDVGEVVDNIDEEIKDNDIKEE